MNAFPRISLGFCALVALLASSSESRADTTNRAKGIAGGALLGAEVVMLTEAVIGAKPTWLYVVGGIAGAGGGGVAGYYLGGSSSPKPPSFVLAGGIALFIPTLIGIVTATQFQPDDSYQHQRSPDEDDDAPEARLEPPQLPAARLELPQVEVAQSFTAEEAHVHQLRQVPAVHLSFLRGVF
jgi:hypothetical protein